MRTMAWAVALTLSSAPLFAQEPAEKPDAVEPEAAQEEAPPARYPIRVLQHPYDLASFYRNENSGGFFAEASDRYPIASFYRSRQTSGYGEFWARGYAVRDGRGRSLFRRSIGENGDLFLFAPVVLAPV